MIEIETVSGQHLETVLFFVSQFIQLFFESGNFVDILLLVGYNYGVKM